MAKHQSGNSQRDDQLQAALEDARRRQVQMSALLAAARAVLDYREFGTAARFVYESCKHAVGAGAGYVALLSEDGTQNEVLFLDVGGIDCTVDPSLPMPIRGLRKEAYAHGRTVYENTFPESPWHDLLPAGHVLLQNVLFAPLLVDGEAVGVLGLANKPGGFSEDDAGLASAFGELCALALLNSRALGSLRSSEERFRAVAQSASDAIITADSRGDIVFWNEAAASIFGYARDEAIGRPLTLIMPERLRTAHRDGMARVVSTGESRRLGETMEMAGLRRDGSVFPVELSLSSWETREGVFFTGILRDITERMRAGEALQKLTRDLGERVKELNCLYGISRLVETPGVSLAGVLEGTVHLLPAAWQHPEATQARITLEGQEFRTKDWADSARKQTADIVVRGECVGAVEVAYLEERPKSDEEPFLQEERSLINAVAEQLGRIIEHRQTEQLLRGQNRFITTVFESLAHPFYVVDANDYTVRLANSAACTGERPEQLSCYALTHQRDAPCVGMQHRCPLEEVKRTRKPVVMEHVHYDREGNPRVYEVHGHPILDSEGHVPQLIEYSLDITERIRAEEEVRSLARFPSENLNPVLRVSQDGTILYANQASASLLAAWDTRTECLLPETWREIVADVALSGEGRTIELPCGEHIYSINLVPVEAASYVNLYGRDVTDRQRAEAALQKERDFTAAVLNTAGALVIVFDPEGRIVRFNRTCEQLTGYAFWEVEGKQFWDLFLVPEEEDPVRAVFAELRAGSFPNSYQNYWLTRQGERRLIAWSNTALVDDSGQVEYIIGTGIDVTERRRAEVALRLAHDELEQRVRERTAELARVNDELRAEIEERMRVEEALRLQSAIAERLSEASTALTQTLDLDTVLNTLLDYLGGLVPYDQASMLMPQDAAHFVVRAARGDAAQVGALAEEGSTVDAADCPLLHALSDAKGGVLVPDARKHPEWTDPHLTTSLCSWLGVPLRNDDKVIGACVLGKAEARFYTEQHVHLAEALVSQASVAVQNAWLFEQVRAGRERLRSLSRRLVEVQETERRYVARELHDEASQALVSLMVGLRLLEQDAQDPQAVVDGVGALKQLVDGVIGDLHRLAMDLCPASLDHLGLVAALRQYVETLRDQHGLEVQYEAVGLDTRLPADVETAIYRVVQEALTNVIRHAHATRVDVLLAKRGSKLVVLVEDNGIGFDTLIARQSGRLGLFGIRERTEMLGGKLEVESAANAGTTVRMEVPYVD